MLAVGNIAGVIYNDTNGNGKQDPNEPGFPGVTVVLKDANGNEIARTVTDANGA
ncbi:SdrD B-like domain-containing protein [Renibacterium salmoninarum]|uniref:SdrD B-like domain-containing protein n=1 Tax=Renibacterium salmoninarum TaxID=1646 RepID=UPI003989992C